MENAGWSPWRKTTHSQKGCRTMNREDIVLSAVGQSQEDKHCVIALW